MWLRGGQHVNVEAPCGSGGSPPNSGELKGPSIKCGNNLIMALEWSRLV